MSEELERVLKFLSAVFIGIFFTTMFIAFMIHIHDISQLSQVDNRIAIKQEQYDRTTKQIALIKEGGTTFRFNSDNPVNSLVAAQINIADKLIEVRTHKIELITSIISRCLSPWAIVVWAFDTVTCKTYRAM